MVVGDIIAKFESPAFAAEALFEIGDLTLALRVADAAARQNITPGEFAVRSIGRFVAAAGDDDWLTLIGRMSCDDDPGRLFLQHVLAGALVAE
jgi:hypothetical protein